MVMVMSKFGFAEAVREAKSRMDMAYAAATRGDWVSVEKRCAMFSATLVNCAL
jgi:hypothetical protein